MSNGFPEKDWKLLRSLSRVALDRICERVMAECAAIMSNSDFSPHERYLRLYRLVQDRNRDIAIAFDDMRRSTGIRHIASMISLDLLTRDELEGFTPQTLAAALDLKGLMRATKRPRRQKT